MPETNRTDNLLSRDGPLVKPTCGYCGRKIDGHGALDHIIPKVQGGSNRKANLLRCCTTCNASKGARTPDQWADNMVPSIQRKLADAQRMFGHLVPMLGLTEEDAEKIASCIEYAHNQLDAGNVTFYFEELVSG